MPNLIISANPYISNTKTTKTQTPKQSDISIHQPAVKIFQGESNTISKIHRVKTFIEKPTLIGSEEMLKKMYEVKDLVRDLYTINKDKTTMEQQHGEKMKRQASLFLTRGKSSSQSNVQILKLREEEAAANREESASEKTDKENRRQEEEDEIVNVLHRSMNAETRGGSISSEVSTRRSFNMQFKRKILKIGIDTITSISIGTSSLPILFIFLLLLVFIVVRSSLAATSLQLLSNMSNLHTLSHHLHPFLFNLMLTDLFHPSHSPFLIPYTLPLQDLVASLDTLQSLHTYYYFPSTPPVLVSASYGYIELVERYREFENSYNKVTGEYDALLYDSATKTAIANSYLNLTSTSVSASEEIEGDMSRIVAKYWITTYCLVGGLISITLVSLFQFYKSAIELDVFIGKCSTVFSRFPSKMIEEEIKRSDAEHRPPASQRASFASRQVEASLGNDNKPVQSSSIQLEVRPDTKGLKGPISQRDQRRDLQTKTISWKPKTAATLDRTPNSRAKFADVNEITTLKKRKYRDSKKLLGGRREIWVVMILIAICFNMPVVLDGIYSSITLRNSVAITALYKELGLILQTGGLNIMIMFAQSVSWGSQSMLVTNRNSILHSGLNFHHYNKLQDLVTTINAYVSDQFLTSNMCTRDLLPSAPLLFACLSAANDAEVYSLIAGGNRIENLILQNELSGGTNMMGYSSIPLLLEAMNSIIVKQALVPLEQAYRDLMRAYSYSLSIYLLIVFSVFICVLYFVYYYRWIRHHSSFWIKSSRSLSVIPMILLQSTSYLKLHFEKLLRTI